MPHDLARLVMERCDTLAAFSEEPGRLTRPSLTPSMRQANDQVAAWMRAAGMAVYEDSVGNLIGTYLADRSNARTLVIGSHLDSVRDAGRYDGPLGVLIGLACVEQLAAQGRRLPFAVEVVAFTDEEGLRFQQSFLGSSAFVGRFPPAWLALRDAQGVTVGEAISAFGGDPELIAQDARSHQGLLAYCEVHIEQGPLLEARGLPVGVVSAITGIHRARVELSGTAGHAGTVPMDLRRDALCAAAELILAAEALARATPGLVATVGQLDARPGASNVIPGAVSLSIDLRHQDDATRLRAAAELQERAAALAAAREIGFSWSLIQDHPAVPCDPDLRERLARAVAEAGHEAIELPSGAGHDAAVLAGAAPSSMLFVRCKGGVSHNPAESVTADDVAVAIDVMGRFIEGLARH